MTASDGPPAAAPPEGRGQALAVDGTHDPDDGAEDEEAGPDEDGRIHGDPSLGGPAACRRAMRDRTGPAA